MVVRFLTFGHMGLRKPIYGQKKVLFGLHSYLNLKRAKNGLMLKFNFTSSEVSQKFFLGPLVPYLETTYLVSQKLPIRCFSYTHF